MKIKVLLLTLSSSFLVASALNAASSERKGDDKSQILHETKKQMDEQVSQLIADRVDFKKTIEFQKIMKLEEQTLEAKENLLYPADELYGANWDNKWVNPFTGKEKVNLPDSFVVNCISFVFPIDSMKKVTSKYGHRSIFHHSYQRIHGGVVFQCGSKGAVSDLYGHLHFCALLLIPGIVRCRISGCRFRLLCRNTGRLRYRWNGPFSAITICFRSWNFRLCRLFLWMHFFHRLVRRTGLWTAGQLSSRLLSSAAPVQQRQGQ